MYMALSWCFRPTLPSYFPLHLPFQTNVTAFTPVNDFTLCWCAPQFPCIGLPRGRAALTFRIGPDFDSAREFVYKLGPQRLDELLSAKVVSERSLPPPPGGT